MPEINDGKLYLMNHLQFQTSDLETLLIDRIIIINNQNIKKYLDKLPRISDEKLNEDIKQIDIILNDKIRSKEDHKNLVKALLIRDYFKSRAKYDELEPIVIIYHPFNKYEYFNTYQIYKNFKISKNFNIIKDIITDSQINETGNGFTDLWDIIKTGDNNLNFKSYTDKSKTTEIKNFNLLESTDYDFVFDAEGNNKQFGDKTDYYTII
jgi:hypothetical protein